MSDDRREAATAESWLKGLVNNGAIRQDWSFALKRYVPIPGGPTGLIEQVDARSL